MGSHNKSIIKTIPRKVILFENLFLINAFQIVPSKAFAKIKSTLIFLIVI